MNDHINPQDLWPDTYDNMPVRLSDFPSSKELWAMGKGSESPDESTFGVLVLDELGASMNTRDWNDTNRKESTGSVQASGSGKNPFYRLTASNRQILRQVHEAAHSIGQVRHKQLFAGCE